ncbi:TetR family transcriptional regulator [Arthrobacter sp. ERGS1:01]|uniref:TetR/AcrR family transcriptional regulator n=1 Tax=Arthrobacter sp. ERGS1:01 TaxID=1704044 RepID=UPI0006B40130|nr:TetR/AcrR family transcriptional regulator [Arthrobacter sp. ERGS1:01]ALE06745.1 TetR family transcriptional regulator [Arthrobacter sp. ERGS1:01]
MSQTPRERAREQTMAEILRIGRSHLALHGAAGLSLRAVARDLGVVSSAVYRYVSSRDELLTLLVVDGYNALGDAVDAAVEAAPAQDFAGQFQALGRAVRTWALAEPARYGLLFGSPVPGYEAPAERTTGPGTRVIGQLVRIFEGAHRAGVLATETARGEPAGGPPADFQAIRDELGVTLGDAALTRGVLVWTALFGAVNFEVFGQYGSGTFSDPGLLFESQLALMAGVAGLVE